jgi:hypothetical protein
MELINLRAILGGEDIPFFVHNDHFGSMQVGPRIELLNAKTICVAERDVVRARELIDDYVTVTAAIPTAISFWHVLRMIVEVLFFNWVFPYRAHRNNGENAV